MRIEIKSRFDGRILFAYEAPKNTLTITAAAAVSAAANLSGANLSGANLSGADLIRANLSGADLIRANLSGANLFGADLTDANLSGADLTDANLSGADLTDANLSGADLSAADLTYANLSGADLSAADLSGAKLTNTKNIIDAGTPDKWRTVGWLRDNWLSVRVGCRDKRLAEGRAYWAGKPDRREVLAALDYIEALAKLRGWKTKE